MIKVCGEGRGGETSMRLEVVGKRGRRASVLVVLAVSNFRVEVGSGKSGKEIYSARYCDSQSIFSSLSDKLRLRSKDRGQVIEQITQFFNRHVGPATSLASTQI